ncbi:hypothetical protein FPV67DRAFT_1672646 [Lyophyllum atratum]|nr:hypothetical protein FPV67DRAFT_1672646 [Lyophyllum atratum]
MPRTSQTADKSTGEPAPRVPLPSRKRARPLDDMGQDGRRSTRKKAPVKKKSSTATDQAPAAANSKAWLPVAPHNDIDTADDIMKVDGGDDGHNTGFSNATEPARLSGGPTTRESFALCSSPALVVISVRLASVNPNGDSARVVFHNLAPYLPNNVAFIDLPWDMGSDTKFEEYNSKVDILVNRLKNGDLRRFRTFAVFFTDHSDPDRGDLHYTVGAQGADTVAAVLENLFPPSLTDLFQVGGRSTLTMLVCGAMMTVDEAYKDIKAFADRGFFAWVMAFGQAHMQPCLTNPLLQAASVAWFVHEKRWDAILDDFQGVGAHTDVYMLQKGMVTMRYTWAHQAAKPFGEPAPYSCPKCGAFKPWGKPTKVELAKKQVVKLEHTCGNGRCGYTVTYRLKKGLVKHSRGNLEKANSTRGEWYREERA